MCLRGGDFKAPSKEVLPRRQSQKGEEKRSEEEGDSSLEPLSAAHEFDSFLSLITSFANPPADCDDITPSSPVSSSLSSFFFGPGNFFPSLTHSIEDGATPIEDEDGAGVDGTSWFRFH